MFAKKNHETLLFCFVKRKIDAILKEDSNLIPLIDACISSLGKTAIFSALDANSRYSEVKTHRADRNIATLTLHHEFYWSIRLLFWVTQRFQHLPTYNEQHTPRDETHMRPHTRLSHCNLLRILAGTHRPHPDRFISLRNANFTPELRNADSSTKQSATLDTRYLS